VKREGIHALAFIPIVADGGTAGKFMTYYGQPHSFEDTERGLALIIARQLGFSLERWRAERDRLMSRDAMAFLASIVESSDDAIVSKRLDGTITSWNGAAARLFGYTPAEIIGCSILTLIPEANHSEEQDIISRIRRGERVQHYETVRRRKDGSLVDLSITVSPIKDASGEIIGASKIARDISERRLTDEHRSLMLRELNHRVNNTLATVQALASQTLRDSVGRTAFEGRLTALSRAHDILTNESWQGAWLRELAIKALAPFDAPNERISIGGPPVRLAPKQAVALAMALHELATNAAKYGALSNDQGKVELVWRRAIQRGRPELHLTWTENGGPAVQRPTRTGFGSRLIGGLAKDVGGSSNMDFRPGGLVFRLVAPIG
jgi:PAS domain S-box-containing protein